MKIIAIFFLFLTMSACSSAPKKSSAKKINTEVYSAICFNPSEIQYETIPDVEMISFNEDGFKVKINGEEKILSNSCIFEQKFRVKKEVQLDPKRYQISCRFDPFYYNTFEGRNYSSYKIYDEGSNLKMVEPRTRQILLLSTQFCDVYSEK